MPKYTIRYSAGYSIRYSVLDYLLEYLLVYRTKIMRRIFKIDLRISNRGRCCAMLRSFMFDITHAQEVILDKL